MKRNLLKIGLPVMAFGFAIAGAFASVSTPNAGESAFATVDGYIFQNAKCEKVTICSDFGGAPCMHNGQVAKTRINETQCGLSLYQWN
ncbi:MAG: hypothetical protein EOP49_07630 [Sphingobacteriales bacterium]|nr:MAG: hypothetical protein EOP49_07630 [Sphingobacteriales bacterium]